MCCNNIFEILYDVIFFQKMSEHEILTIKPGPVYQATEEEWADANGFLSKLHGKVVDGKKLSEYAAVLVKPPPSWSGRKKEFRPEDHFSEKICQIFQKISVCKLLYTDYFAS